MVGSQSVEESGHRLEAQKSICLGINSALVTTQDLGAGSDVHQRPDNDGTTMEQVVVDSPMCQGQSNSRLLKDRP